MKKLIILWSMVGIGFFGLGVGAYLEDNEPEQPASEEVSVEKEGVVDEEVVKEDLDDEGFMEEDSIVEEEIKTDVTETENAKTMHDILKTTFNGIADVEFDDVDKTYIIHPTDPAFIRDFMLTYDGLMPKDSWNTIIENTRVVSDAMTKRVGPGYYIKIANPANADNAIAIFSDGVVHYDVMESR